MNLHLNKKELSAAIRATSEYYKINPVFVEKDYWITLVLKRLSESKFKNDVVFKGGTSLSKGYNLINRFSEDVDIAVLNVDKISGNKVKTIIREVEKEISIDLTEDAENKKSSKGSRFRKSYYFFPKSDVNGIYSGISDQLIIEINSFANPIPYQEREITSMISRFLASNNQKELLNKYELMPFRILVLSKYQTMIEKTASLIRFSFEDNPIDGILSKIRHFYDLYYLFIDSQVKKAMGKDSFKEDFNNLWLHDQEAFELPINWKGKTFKDSVLFKDFDRVWQQIRSNYSTELSMISFSEIPEPEKVQESFKKLISKLL